MVAEWEKRCLTELGRRHQLALWTPHYSAVTQSAQETQKATKDKDVRLPPLTASCDVQQEGTHDVEGIPMPKPRTTPLEAKQE